MSDTITIPLNRLAPWDGNVRRTGIHGGIAELAASIASHGLLQSLVVRNGKRGKYEIVAGQRRFLALTSLAKDGTIAKDFAVPCMLAEDGIDATELFRPQTGYYPDLVAEAAALWESLSQNHPFVDGNKRTAFAVTVTFLAVNGINLDAPEEAAMKFLLPLYDRSALTFEKLDAWLRRNTSAD